MIYRPEIDGLRALAVLPVMLFHAGFSLFSGGFVGVDIFFVVSGYLITTIIYTEIANGNFSITKFYERRARRILPALFLVMGCSIPFSWFLMLPDEFRDFSQSLIAVNLFSSNVLFYLESGYFDLTNEYKPLLHTWSLAVEEQFYIFFPVLLIFLKNISPNLLTIVSLGIAQAFSTTHPTANFYLLPSRVWELSIGSLIALFPALKALSPTNSTQVQLPDSFFGLSASLGLGLIAYSVVAFDSSTPFPSYLTLLPTIGTALVIIGANSSNWPGKILSHKVLVGIGLISYSAYLWHQPILAFARLRAIEEMNTTTTLFLIALSLLLAFISWKYIEAPFRDKTKFSKSKIFLYAAIAASLFIAIGAIGIYKAGFPNRLDERSLALLSEATNTPQDCILHRAQYFDASNLCSSGSKIPAFVLWGDSHANSLAYALKNVLAEKDESLIELTVTGCTPVIGYEWKNKGFNCTEKLTAMKNHVHNNPELAKVLLVHGRWTNLANPIPFDNQEGGKELELVTAPLLVRSEHLIPSEKLWLDEIFVRTDETLRSLLDAGQKIALIYSVPEVGWNVPRLLARSELMASPITGDVSTSHEVFKQRAAKGYEMLDNIGDHPNLIRIFPEEVLCSSVKDGRCMATLNKQPLYVDDDHLSRLGAEMVSRLIVDKLVDANWL